MAFKSVIKSSIKHFLKLFKSEYLLEYWQLKRNEKTTLLPILKFYTGFIKPGMKVIDVGANIGTYSKAFIELGASVISLEPQNYCQKILKKRFKDESKFKLIPKACGANVSKGEIHKSRSHTIASMNEKWINSVSESERFNDENWNQKEEINITTLDIIINENNEVDYIKIDVEGFELEVLKGLRKPVNFISFEITLPEMQQTAIDCINEIDSIADYLFVVPNKDKLLDIETWFEKSKIIEQLEALGKSSNNVSADIFCKKI